MPLRTLFLKKPLLCNPNARSDTWHAHSRRRACLLLSIVFFTLLACQEKLQTLSGVLPIQLPQVITAGESVTVTVGPVNVVDGTRIGLVMVGKGGPRVYNGKFERGVAEFNIPGQDTLQHGYLAFIAAAQEARGEAAMILRPRTNPNGSAAIVNSL
jgi:hypothetical protein